GLQTLGTPHDFADYACALAGCLEAAMSETRYMQENVGKVFIRNDKSVAFRRIEPLDRSRYFEDLRCGFLGVLGRTFQPLRCFPPHDDLRPHTFELPVTPT